MNRHENSNFKSWQVTKTSTILIDFNGYKTQFLLQGERIKKIQITIVTNYFYHFYKLRTRALAWQRKF